MKGSDHMINIKEMFGKELKEVSFKEIAESNDLTLEEKERLMEERSKIDDFDGNECRRYLNEASIVGRD